MNSKYQLHLCGLKHGQYSYWIQTWLPAVWQDCVNMLYCWRNWLIATQEKIPNLVPKEKLVKDVAFLADMTFSKQKCMILIVHSLWNYVFGRPIWQEQSVPLSILRSFSKNENDSLNYISIVVDLKFQTK